MDRCPFTHARGAHHADPCQCGRAGFDHLEHRAPCGTTWISAATAAQIDALRVIADHPGIKAIAFSRIRESRGQTYKRLLALGFIRVEKAAVWAGAQAFVTEAGVRATEELVDSRQAGVR